DRDVPGREAVRLEENDVVVRLAALELAGDDLLELVDLEPVEHPRLDRLDQVARLEPRLLARVAADESRALEHDVVELAGPRLVCADRADEGSGPQPLPAQDRILRCGHGDDYVAIGRLARRLARLGARLRTELRESLRRPAVGDDALDARQGLEDAGDLAPRLPPAADHAEARRTRPRQVLRRNAAGGAGPELAQLVRLDHRRKLRRPRVEEDDDERRPAREP